jgi:hypothetical protein
VILTAKKIMKRKKFKRKAVVLSALEVLVFAPYGNSANRVETAPVPVEWRHVKLSEISSRIENRCIPAGTWQLAEGREVTLDTAICRGRG